MLSFKVLTKRSKSDKFITPIHCVNIQLMFLRYRLNYKYSTVHTGSSDKLPVLLKDGEVVMIKFLGFIEREEAKSSERAISCKIKSITAYSKLNFNFIDLPKSCLLQGCILNNGLYCVLEYDKPRILDSVDIDMN